MTIKLDMTRSSVSLYLCIFLVWGGMDGYAFKIRQWSVYEHKLNSWICLWFSSANKCLLKVGHYSAQLEQYQKAIEIYEQVLPRSAILRE